MEQYLEFAGNHPFLIGAFALVLATIVWTETRRFTGGYQRLSPSDAVRLMNDGDTLLLDVREDAELQQGMIDGAKHIPLGNLAKRIGELDKHKNKNILAYCRTGSRSAQACGILRKNQFEKVHNLSGGLMAWQSANLPVKRRR